MKRVLTVARWEFLSAVRSASFIGLAIGLPLVHIGLAALMGLSMRTAERHDTSSQPVVVVDAPGVLHRGDFADGKVVGDEAAALGELNAGRADAVVILAPDYFSSGRVRVYAPRARGLLALGGDLQRQRRAESVIRQAIASPSLADGERARIVKPIVALERFHMEADGNAVRDSGSALAMLGGAFGVSFLFGLSIFLSAGLLQHAMGAERENRMLEVLLVSIRPLELLSGKVIGLGAAGLLQIGVYLVLALGVAPAVLGMYDVPASMVAWLLVCFAAGYVLFACVMAATGTLGHDVQASGHIASALMLAGASPMFFITFISADQNSWIARSLSWFPLTSPVALLLRLGTGKVAILEIVGPLALTITTAALTLYVSAALLHRIAVGMEFRLTRVVK